MGSPLVVSFCPEIKFLEIRLKCCRECVFLSVVQRLVTIGYGAESKISEHIRALNAKYRGQCHLIFGEKIIFTMRAARAARKTAKTSIILLAGLAELLVKKWINFKK